ncbi:MAG: hypothetical protein JWP44_3975 [Mucilaginibacter sp.]|nr:hypothetical protein [Mucilaginibacter sp.]
MKRFSSYLLKQQDNLVAATANLLNLLNVKVTSTVVKNAIMGNPGYPSLLAVSESLKLWGIECEGYTITEDKLQILPVPFIAHLKINSGSFVAVKAVDATSVTYLEDDQSVKKISLNEFLGQWSHTVLLAEALPQNGQADYAKAIRREQLTALRFPLLIVVFLSMALIRFWGAAGSINGAVFYLYSGYWICAVLGTVISSLLLWYDYDKNNSYLKKICSINKKTDCNAVLSSSASKIFGFSWSEIGFFYFFGALMYLSISNNYAGAVYPLILLNLVALPYIVFSVYYQALVVKQWCMLCLAVQFILFAGFLTTVVTSRLNSNLFFEFGRLEYSQLLMAYLLPPVIWTIIKPYLYGAKENEKTNFNFRRFKNNPEVFNSIMQKHAFINNNPEGLGIVLGNPEAENTLIKVCNPYCGPCAQSFPHLEELINTNKNWKVQIIFTATGDKNDHRALPVAHFMALKDQKHMNGTIVKALGDWYNAKEKNYEAYVKTYPVAVDFELQKEKLVAMSNWCQLENIQFTPTYFVNGRPLPDTYTIEDLKNIF